MAEFDFLGGTGVLAGGSFTIQYQSPEAGNSFKLQGPPPVTPPPPPPPVGSAWGCCWMCWAEWKYGWRNPQTRVRHQVMLLSQPAKACHRSESWHRKGHSNQPGLSARASEAGERAAQYL